MKNTYSDELAAADHDAIAAAKEDLAERMAAFDAGLCSLGAAYEGGARYAAELAESAEIAETVAAPIAAALNGWLRVTRAGKAA
jgi:hypothetical protein